MIKEESGKQNRKLLRLKKKNLTQLLRSIAAATQEQTNRDNFDLLDKYVVTKMRKLSQKLDEDATEAVEYDITIQSL